MSEAYSISMNGPEPNYPDVFSLDQTILDNLPLMICYVDQDLRYRYANHSYAVFFNLDREAIVGSDLESVLGTNLLSQVKRYIDQALLGQRVHYTRLLDNQQDGPQQMIDVTFAPDLRNGEVVGYYAILNDLTDDPESPVRLKYEATHDSLTGLGNRSLLYHDVDLTIEKYMEDQTPAALMYMDLDRFKKINDSMGHHAGDELLCVFAKRLQDFFQHHIHIYRLGGDEFAILVNGEDQQSMLKTLAEEILSTLQVPVVIHNHPIHLSASIGIVNDFKGYVDASEILRDADLAMYDAKKQRDSYRFFDSEMRVHALSMLKMEGLLESAIEYGNITPHLQPIIDLQSQKVIGFEALARWKNSKGHQIPPQQFIPCAEDTGQIITLGAQIMLKTLSMADTLLSQVNGEDYFISINISPVQLHSMAFEQTLDYVLQQTGFEPTHLVLEVTEEVAHPDQAELIAKLHRIRHKGIRVACDDFGIGYANLSSLEDMPWDIIKIDRSFLTEGGASALLGPIMEIAQALGMPTVIEGIENRVQHEAIIGFPCQYAQGFWYGRPDSVENIIKGLVLPFESA